MLSLGLVPMTPSAHLVLLLIAALLQQNLEGQYMCNIYECPYFETIATSIKRSPISNDKFESQNSEVHWCSHEGSQFPKCLAKAIGNKIPCMGNLDHCDLPDGIK